MTGPSWRDDATCVGINPELWFPASYISDVGVFQAATAISICVRCPVRLACLDEAMAVEGGQHHSYRDGVFGGLVPQDRYALYKRLAAARARQASQGLAA